MVKVHKIPEVWEESNISCIGQIGNTTLHQNTQSFTLLCICSLRLILTVLCQSSVLITTRFRGPASSSASMPLVTIFPQNCTVPASLRLRGRAVQLIESQSSWSQDIRIKLFQFCLFICVGNFRCEGVFLNKKSFLENVNLGFSPQT